MKYYQVIDIINEEPLKIGANGNKTSWTEPCKDFIPGSTLRGAAISQILQHNICTEDQLAPILRELICYNAYLVDPDANHVYFPAPLHLRIDKHNWREEKAKGENANPVKLTNLVNGKQTGSFSKNNLPVSFVSIQDNVLQGIKINKSYYQHLSKNRNKNEKERNNLFNYQAIEPGYAFRTVIMYDQEIELAVEQLFQKLDIWYIGGSKGSGYGKSRVTRVGNPVQSFNEVRSHLFGKSSNSITSGSQNNTWAANQLIITCLSDCLYRNEFGQPINYIPLNIFQESSDIRISLTLKEQYVQSSLSEGFNTKWHARYPKEATIKAGSVFVYEFSEDTKIADRKKLIESLESQPIGYRIQDGFGWLAINIRYPETFVVREPQSYSSQSKLNDRDKKNEMLGSLSLRMDEKEIEVMKIIQKGLKDTRTNWLRMIVKRSLDSKEDLKSNRDFVFSRDIKPSYYANLYRIVTEWLVATEFNKINRMDYRIEYSKILDRDHAKDQTKCSIAGCHFRELISFLQNEAFDRSKLIKLKKFAEMYLNSKSGQLYYGASDNVDTQRIFIAELLKEALYYNWRGWEYEANKLAEQEADV